MTSDKIVEVGRRTNRERVPLPSQDDLIKWLRYDEETGKLYWRNERPWFYMKDLDATTATNSWNKRCGGKIAFNTVIHGHYRGFINAQGFYAHRIIWKMIHGTEPYQIDHVNGCGTDNRLSNLRAVTQLENSKNARLHEKNTSGYAGVSRARNKWLAQIVVNYKQIYLGEHLTKEAAIEARKAAEKKYGFHPNHGKSALSTNNNSDGNSDKQQPQGGE